MQDLAYSKAFVFTCTSYLQTIKEGNIMKTLKMVFLMVILSLFVNGVVFAMVNVKGSWEGEIRIPPADYATDLL